MADLENYWDTHQNEKWHPHLKEVGRRVFEVFKAYGGKWYPTGRKPVESVAGLRIKPAIRGVRVHDKTAFPCLINPRSSLYFDSLIALPFVARGIHEMHVRDEIGAVRPMIVDLGKEHGARANRVHFPTEEGMISVEQFEEIMKNFNEALLLAGLAGDRVARGSDLFKPR